MELREVGKKIEDGFKSDSISLGYEAVFQRSDIKVIKKVGADADDSSFMTEQDLVDDKPITENPDDGQSESEEKSSMIAVALGIIFGIIGAILIALVVYHFWKKSKLKAVGNVPQEEA